MSRDVERRFGPQGPQMPRFLWFDAWLDLMLTEGSLQVAFLAVIGAGLATALPMAPPAQFFLLQVLLPVVLALAGLKALEAGKKRIRDRFETRFWNDLRFAALFFIGAAGARSLTYGQDQLWPYLPAGILLFLAYAMLLLATEAQPHREGFWRSEKLERRLSLLTLTTFGAGLFVYFAAIPALISGRLPAAVSQATMLFAVLAALLTARLAVFARRVDSLRWRTIYQVMAAASLGLTLFHLMRAGRFVDGSAQIHRGTNPWLWALPVLLWVFSVRLRHYPFPARWQPVGPRREPLDDAVEQNRLGLDFRTLLLAIGVPLLHFAGYRLNLLAPESREARELWMLCWTAGLGVLAFGQQRINGNRLLSLLSEQRKIARTLAAGERRLFMVEERKSADEALFYSREKYAKAFRTGPYGLVTLEAGSGLHVHANEQYLSLMGLRRDDFTRWRLSDLMVPEERLQWLELDRLMQLEGEVRNHQVRLRDRRQQERKLSLSARRLETRDAVSYVAICNDLTGLEQRRRSKGLQRRLFEECSDGAVVIDTRGRVMAVNLAARERLDVEPHLGADADREDSRHPADERPPIDRLIVAGPELTAAELASTEGRQWLGRLEFRLAGGEVETLSCWWMPLARDGKKFKDRLILILSRTPAKVARGL